MSRSIVDRFRAAPVPEAYSRQSLNEMFVQGLLAIADLPPFPKETIQALTDPKVDELVDQSKLTMAIVRPNLPDAMISKPDRAATDAEFVEFLLNQIQPPLERIFVVSLLLNPDDVEDLYGDGPKQKQLKDPPVLPENASRHGNRWEEYIDMMTVGPSTSAILYAEEGNAVTEWRRQMGVTWRLDTLRSYHSESLRARYAKSTYNVLLHGSDSPEAVRKELDWLVKKLRG